MVLAHLAKRIAVYVKNGNIHGDESATDLVWQIVTETRAVEQPTKENIFTDIYV